MSPDWTGDRLLGGGGAAHRKRCSDPTFQRVLVAAKPVDFRKSMDGLTALMQQQLGADPFSGVVYVFRSKRTDRVKLLHWDGTGLVPIAKRLEAGQFRWPAIRDGVIRVRGLRVPRPTSAA
ncbi:IS66 family insertion sequence element accessory protein TnpB [Azospirillum sp. B506]|uniref:IS66 family insertion sequence element accessory protein TnpB n=1 Tax=Azospirillum sp. B506 TaxID=137721 RepID=UPI00034C4C35|nr:IS66 family insertion sequence element accessory protein TnpB [Azospirillum sp. B506]